MKCKFSLFLVLLSAMTFCSCDKNEEDLIPLGQIKVEINFPEGYSDLSKENINVNLFQDASEIVFLSAKTNAEGFVVFEDLILGNYTAKASVKISAVKAEQITGIAEEVELKSISTNNNVVNNANVEVTLSMKASEIGGLMIKEFYFGFASNDNWEMRTDAAFLEIYNNSNHTIHLDGLYIGFTPNEMYIDKWKSDAENAYLSQIFKIPGKGSDNPLEPGKSIVIARTAINHIDGGGLSDELKEQWVLEGTVKESVDLSDADFEIFIDGKDDNTTDFDVRNVPNLLTAWQSSKFNDLAITGRGASVVIFRDNKDVATSLVSEEIKHISARNTVSIFNYKKLPVSQAIDAIEIQDGRCFPESLVGSPLLPIFENYMPFTAKSFRRKVAKTVNGMRILLDTNNNLLDFELIEHSTPKNWN